MATDPVIEDFDDNEEEGELCAKDCPICAEQIGSACLDCGAAAGEECDGDCPSWDEEEY